ncbi:MAG: peptidoglycan DD-metalloendopeptidase family protein [Spirochaetes bacterium]|nr:peptidoglycan DD-metalloendopeptidase family protein [Spirochaetota bacterium]
MARLSSLVTYTETNAQVKKLQDVSYTFKIDNSIAGVTNTPDIDTGGAYVSAVSYNYKYDGLNRLVKAEGMYSRATAPNSGTLETVKQFETGWTYAPNGNMTGREIFDPVTHATEDSLQYTYGANNHAVTSITSRLTSEEKYAMQYDACGNMVGQTNPQPPPGQGPDSPLSGGATIATKEMQYDSYNRITRVTNTDTSEVVGQYWYDDQGFRVRKVAKRVVGGEDRQVEVLYPSMYFGLEKQRDSGGTEVPNSVYSVNNIYLEGVRIAAVIPSGDARYYLTDQVDSVKVVADDNGLPVSRMEYMPYGETWFQEGDTNNAPKYNSQELDTESNFYYYNARHYSQEIARFVTADTVIDGEFDTQGWNRYSYCKNNPIEYKDPTGHERFPTVSRSFDEIFNENVSDEQYANDSAKSGPNQGKVVNNLKGHYGNTRYDGTVKHRGIDIKGKKGDPVLAYAEGKVARIIKDHETAGNFIVLEHQRKVYDKKTDSFKNETYVTRYLHLDKINVKKGDKIKEGQKIGTIGNTGSCVDYDPHLHFEVRKMKKNANIQEARKNEFVNQYTTEVDPVKDLKTNQTFFQKVKEHLTNLMK